MSNILCKLQDQKESEVDVQRTAHHIAEQAYELSFDQDYLSPFALSAQQRGINLRGMHLNIIFKLCQVLFMVKIGRNAPF